MKLAARMARLGTETAFEVLVRARSLEAQGRSIIHLEIGEPDFNTPHHVVEAGKTALDQGWTHYGPTQGCGIARDHRALRFAHAIRSRRCVVPGGKIIFPDDGPARRGAGHLPSPAS